MDFLCLCGAAAPRGPLVSSFLKFLDHKQRRTTVGRTPLDEWSARLRDLYLTPHNNHKRRTSIPPEGFEPTIPKGERPQTYFPIWGDRGGTVVKVLCYKSEGRWFDPRWCHWHFLLTSSRSHYGPEVDSASNSNEYQENFLGVNAAGG